MRFLVCTTVVLVLTAVWWADLLTVTCFTFVPCAPFFTTVTEVVLWVAAACLCTITLAAFAGGELECPISIE